MIDVRKLFRTHMRRQMGNEWTDVPDGQIDTNCVELTLLSCEWPRSEESVMRKECNTMKVSNPNNTSPAVFKRVVTRDSKDFIKVTLEKGVVRGLNRLLRLPLDQHAKKLITKFGKELTIDPSKVDAYTHQCKKTIDDSVLGAGKSKQSGSATLCYEEMKYTGHFKCTVRMKGNVLTSGLEQQQIGDVISDLQPSNPDLQAVEIISPTPRTEGIKCVQFTMEGELECTWDDDSTLDYK